MQACEHFILRSKNLHLVERYMQLLENTLRDLYRTTPHSDEMRLMKAKLDDAYHAKLLNAIANARIEGGIFWPTGAIENELTILCKCISNRIWLLENCQKETFPAPSTQDTSPDARQFYKHHRDQMLAFALEPIDLEQIKQNYDEHFDGAHNDPIRPFSCVNIPEAKICADLP